MKKRTTTWRRSLGEMAVAITCTGFTVAAAGGGAPAGAVDMRPGESDATDGASYSLALSETGEGTEGYLKIIRAEPGAELIAHGHVGACPLVDPAAEFADTTGGHYMDDPAGPVDDVNELWFRLEESGKSGNYKARAAVDWTARDGEMNSVVVHQRQSDGSNPKVLCIDIR